MPSLYSLMGYKIYFWLNENGEPVHVHICKGSPSASSTKIWLTKSGKTLLASNTSQIPVKDLNKLCRFIESNYDDIISRWHEIFGHEKFYC